MTPSDGSPAAGSAIDMAAAMERVDGDREFLTELATIFLEEAPGIMEQISTGLRGGDARAVEMGAHTLKGSAANLAAHEVSETSLRLEQMARTGALVDCAAVFESLEASMTQLRRELEALL